MEHFPSSHVALGHQESQEHICTNHSLLIVCRWQEPRGDKEEKGCKSKQNKGAMLAHVTYCTCIDERHPKNHPEPFVSAYFFLETQGHSKTQEVVSSLSIHGWLMLDVDAAEAGLPESC
jgi:hypothetical protein